MLKKVLTGLGANSFMIAGFKSECEQSGVEFDFSWLHGQFGLPLAIRTLAVSFPDADYLLSRAHSKRQQWMRIWDETLEVFSGKHAGVIVQHSSASDLIVHNWKPGFLDLVRRESLASETFPWGMFHPHKGDMFFVQRLSDFVKVLAHYVEL